MLEDIILLDLIVPPEASRAQAIRQIVGIFRGWLIGPISGIALAALGELLARQLGG